MKWEGRENTYLMMTVIHRRNNRIYIDQALRERKEEKKNSDGEKINSCNSGPVGMGRIFSHRPVKSGNYFGQSGASRGR